MVHTFITKEEATTNSFKAPYLELFTTSTPNGYKITILLELLKLDYYVRKMDLAAGEHKEEWYLNLDPNGKVPSLTSVDKDGNKIHVNESAAIMMFIADKFDKDFKYSFPHGSKEYYEMVEWLFFQMSGLGPMKGQYHWFTRFAPQKDEFAIERYYKETLRLFGVMEARLEKNNTGFLVSDHLTLADIVSYPWIGNIAKIPELKDYPKLSKWVDDIEKIPEVVAACKIPEFIFPKQAEPTKEE